MQNILTVTTLNNQIKSLLESHYLSVHVQGEVSRVTYHSSGHLYFTLKDAGASISCVMFKGNNQKLKFRVEEGMQVILFGGLSVYTPRGSYQINCITMQPSGEGALALAYQQLKKKLQEKGYFDETHKKPLPSMPKHIVLVTSKTGAALQDMLRVAKKRWNLLKITLIDTLVQGESAAQNIAKHIMIADTLGADAIVVGRGGGSMEDLWAFNEEIVADAIYQANTPIISAVGHEIDTLISDYCADLRAPTPSAAMEMLLPDQVELQLTLDSYESAYHDSFSRIYAKKQQALTHQYHMLKQHSFERKLHFYTQEINTLKSRFQSTFGYLLQEKEQQRIQNQALLTQKLQQLLSQKAASLRLLEENFSNNDPHKKDKKGIAQVVKEGKKVALDSVEVDDTIELQSAKVTLLAKKKKKRTTG